MSIPVESGVTIGSGGQFVPLAVLVGGTLTLEAGELFVRGDANAGTGVNIADAIFVLAYLFGGGAAPSCVLAADANGDEAVDMGDPVYILRGLFAGGPPPSAPYPQCGVDPTPGTLSCASFDSCQAPTFPRLTFAGINTQGYAEYTLDLDPSLVLYYLWKAPSRRGRTTAIPTSSRCTR